MRCDVPCPVRACWVAGMRTRRNRSAVAGECGPKRMLYRPDGVAIEYQEKPMTKMNAAENSGDRILTLDQLEVGCCGTIENVAARNGCGQFLAEMGLTNGARVTVSGTAPLGDPIEVSVRGYRLSLRRSEASTIRVLPSPAQGLAT